MRSPRRLQVLSCGLMLIGAALVLSAVESTGIAIDCVQGDPQSPADCIPAFSTPMPEDFETGGASGCAMTDHCGTSGPGCDSNPHWTNARDGKCQIVVGGSNPHTCIENYYRSQVTISVVTGACITQGGECGCKYTLHQPSQTQNIDVCNCFQSAM